MVITVGAPTLDRALQVWPTAVRAELARRRVQVTEAVEVIEGSEGRVLDLADAGARRLVIRAAALTTAGAGQSAAETDAEADDTDDAYDAVISIAGLVHFADLAAALVGIDRLLGPTGELWFVEPIARPGWRGLLGATAGALLPPVRDLHLGRNIPHAVRTTGLLITDIKRFSMPTSIWPLRPFVHARAMHFPEVQA